MSRISLSSTARLRLRLNRNTALAVLFMLGLVFAFTVNLDSTPPVWWDEGWTLTVARTWVERGYYARLLDGQIAAPGLEAAYPTTASVALSFRLLGIGLWQGRLVGVIFTLAAIALTYFLACRLYDQKVGWASIAVLLLFPLHNQAQPLIMGRQILAEPAMLFFLLAGYACLFLAFKRSLWFLPLAILLFGIGLTTKGQAPPFWIVSLAGALVVSIVTRHWAKSALLIVVLIGSLVIWRSLLALPAALLQRSYLAPVPITGMNEVVGVVLDPGERLFAAQLVLLYQLPTVAGLVYAAWKSKRKIGDAGADIDVEIVRLGLLVLAGSWLGWYLLLANAGIARYIFPPTFLASMFVASLLNDLTDHFDFRGTVRRGVEGLKQLRFSRRNVAALLAIALPAIAVSQSLLIVAYLYFISPDTSAQKTAAYLNAQTPTDALIETYDSELFFFLNRRYHYPPDQTNVPLVRHNFDLTATVDYDPLTSNPDYLVLGPSPFSSGWSIYDQALASGAFRLIQQYGRYRVYQRVR